MIEIYPFEQAPPTLRRLGEQTADSLGDRKIRWVLVAPGRTDWQETDVVAVLCDKIGLYFQRKCDAESWRAQVLNRFEIAHFVAYE